MTFTEQEVEWIVTEVIRRLNLLTTNGATKGARSSTTADLDLSDKLITLRTIDGKLTGIARVLIAPRAIVTPAARDELKQRRIELIRRPTT